MAFIYIPLRLIKFALATGWWYQWSYRKVGFLTYTTDKPQGPEESNLSAIPKFYRAKRSCLSKCDRCLRMVCYIIFRSRYSLYLPHVNLLWARSFT